MQNFMVMLPVLTSLSNRRRPRRPLSVLPRMVGFISWRCVLPGDGPPGTPAFAEQRLDGLRDEPRSGAPRMVDDARIEAGRQRLRRGGCPPSTRWLPKPVLPLSAITDLKPYGMDAGASQHRHRDAAQPCPGSRKPLVEGEKAIAIGGGSQMEGDGEVHAALGPAQGGGEIAVRGDGAAGAGAVKAPWHRYPLSA